MPPRVRQISMVLGYGLVLALLATGVLMVAARRPAGTPIQLAPLPTPKPLRVHVTGAVVAPAVYELAPGSIVQDAINAAGGATAEADLGQINLARLLRDGDQVLVPEKPAVPAAGALTPASTGQPAAPGKINLNTASAGELEGLPGIGPALAERIVEYRQSNGAFATIEAVMDVPGIGDAKFEAIKALITV